MLLGDLIIGKLLLFLILDKKKLKIIMKFKDEKSKENEFEYK